MKLLEKDKNIIEGLLYGQKSKLKLIQRITNYYYIVISKLIMKRIWSTKYINMDS